MKILLPLQLGNVDPICGMQWLHTLGVGEVDWKALTITIGSEELKIIVKGDPF